LHFEDRSSVDTNRPGPRVLVADRALAAQRVRERVLEFMKSNPTAWRAKTLAARLGIKVEHLRAELNRLHGEGKLVSCTVSAPNQRPQEEYRIAANALPFNLRQFVISKKTAPRPGKSARIAVRATHK